MIAASIFNTVEFYVIAATVAAAVVAASAIPSRRGAARTFLIAGTLDESATEPAGAPAIDLEVLSDGRLRIRRTGLEGIRADGAYSLAVQTIGLDVTIKERLTASRRPVAGNSAADIDREVTAAEAVLDCLGRERYHFQYLSEATGRSTAFSLNISPGNRLHRPLTL